MSKINLDEEKIESALGAFVRLINSDVLEKVNPVAEILKNSGDDNPLVQQTLEAAVNFQNQFNVAVESAKGAIEDAGEVINIAEYLRKTASVGEVKSRDVSFQNSKIDSSSVMQ